MFTDDDLAWARLLGVEGRPATYVVSPRGEVVWHYQGQLTSADLAAALKKYLAAGGVLRPRLLQSSVRLGRPTMNFLFQYAPGRELTLRKLTGRPVVLAFWKSSSLPSVETLRDLQKAFANAGRQGPILLAINEGEVPEVATEAAAENGISAVVVPDPECQISLAPTGSTYGPRRFFSTLSVSPGASATAVLRGN
jgi:peroxiredoxin